MLSPDSSIGRRATTLGQHTITILVDSIRICKSSHEVGGQLNLQLFLGGSKLVDFWEEQLDPIRDSPYSSSKAQLGGFDADQLVLAGANRRYLIYADSSIGRRATTLGQHTTTTLVDSIRICKSSHEVGGQLNLLLYLGASHSRQLLRVLDSSVSDLMFAASTPLVVSSISCRKDVYGYLR
ncbi:hypothetical protein PGTUg99_023774 [Puccinia graminis f. sp. tritici]|uniref:Uncharacterized protein n=1 Tax=Puccinia graminis f. sp. tritici TaxID=56615 RepID=A0A5B0REN7_PUCGR|nr:hypothetical protein PGTUg99_023774 [Puccinia graminis f. sp. tritici]